MKFRRSPIPSEADLTALADGSLPAGRRIPVERAVAESPRLQAVVAAQRQALSAIDRVSDEAAPPALRARLALAHPPSRVRARLWPVGLVAGSMTAVLAAVVVVVITVGGGSPHPTVLQASLMATRPAQASVRSPSGQSQTLPNVTADGLTYPYLGDQFGYQAVGVRYDGFAGRRITTVLYSRGPSRLAYEIVSGPPLALGQGGWTVTRHGVHFWAMHGVAGSILTWVRDGHSCVLVGRGMTVPAMLHLASWHQGGRIPY